MIVCWMMLWATIASTSLYVDPKNIQAISFPAPRILSGEGVLIPETLHILCEWDFNQFCRSQNATFIDEDRMHCYANDPLLVVRHALVNCTNVPSKDERVIIAETIEQDSCFVTVEIETFESPPLKPIVENANPMWIPRSKEDVERILKEQNNQQFNPDHLMYGSRMKKYQPSFSSRQIAQFEKGESLRVSCWTKKDAERMKETVQNIRDHIQQHRHALHELNEKDIGDILAPFIILFAIIFTLLFLMCGCSASKFITIAIRSIIFFSCIVLGCAVVGAIFMGLFFTSIKFLNI